VQHAHLGPEAVEDVVLHLLGPERVEPGTVDVAQGEQHRAIGQGRQDLDIGTGHTCAAGQQQKEGLVLDGMLEGQDGPSVAAPQHRRLVRAEQEVGVAAVPGVDLDQGSPALGGVDPVQLGEASIVALDGQIGDLDAGLAQGGDDGLR